MSNEITAAFIAKHHPRVKDLMLTRQEEHTGKRDWSVFSETLDPSCHISFRWAETPEKYEPWQQALLHGNFAPLYALHPEWGEPKPTEPKPLIDGEWYWVKQYEHSEWLIGWHKSSYFAFAGYATIVPALNIHAIHPEPIKKPE